jgi:DNA-binding CsgD family transcriptional regulator/energy-coupling factor transporter ATP-binding protein EcfA2
MELIERGSFLVELQSQLTQIETGEGHCVFVSGEAGMGKTTLIKTFCKALGNEHTVLLGTCDALFAPRPLAPLYDILLQLGHSLPENSADIVDRTAFFSGIFRELNNRKRTSLLVFEDVHWADEATLDFIKFLARRITQLKCLFICTYRDDEIHARHPLRGVLGQLNPDSLTRMQLTPLSRQAVHKLADEKGYDAEQVYSIAGGNPFYVNEILLSDSQGVPDSIKEAVLAVYNRMDEVTKEAWQLLSVIPDGLELTRLIQVDPSWHEAIGNSIERKVLVINNNKLFFKHELYRRTIEVSLSPFKRVALNRQLLDLFLTTFEQEGEIERIVHYAKNALENKLVVQYAPLAARQASLVGAHIEAAKLYFTAIEYAEVQEGDQLVELYEAYAYECYLTNQVKEAIIYQTKALKVWQDKKEIEKTGDSLRFLSRLWWFEGKREEAEKYGKQAVEILAPQPYLRAKAMAFSNMSQLTLFSNELAACVEWGNRAIGIAKGIGDDEILCHALNNVGCAQWKVWSSEEPGKKLLMESLEIALKNSFHEYAARAYSNISSCAVSSKEYAAANRFLEEGIAYCEERDLDSSNGYKLYLKSRVLMETGDWEKATVVVKDLLANPLAGTVRVGALVILATIKIRRGEADPLPYLLEAKSIAFTTKEYHRILHMMIAVFEYEWMMGRRLLTEEEVKAGIDLIQTVDNIFLNSEFAFWLKKSRQTVINLPDLYEPYKLLQAGKATMAARFWGRKACSFEQALALFEGDEGDKREAFLLFQQLGAEAVCQKVKMEMRANGIKRIPRGIRESTKTNPAQLTNREMDILQLLKRGIQNKEIAGVLFISPKTVDHHISSILFKLDVNSRSKAVMEGVRLGILQ